MSLELMSMAQQYAGSIGRMDSIRAMVDLYLMAHLCLRDAMHSGGLECPFTWRWIIECEKYLDVMLTDAIIKKRACETISDACNAQLAALTSTINAPLHEWPDSTKKRAFNITLKPDFFRSPQMRWGGDE